MTVSTTTAEVIYSGDGIASVFSVPFVFFAPTELEVTLRAISAGADTLQVLTTNYTVAGGNGAGGTVTMLSPPSAAFQVIIRRRTARTQLVDYLTADAFPAETHERALDRLAAIAQEIDARIARGAGIWRLVGNVAEFVVGAENKLIFTSSILAPSVQLPDAGTNVGRELTFTNAMTGPALSVGVAGSYQTRVGTTTSVLFAAGTAGAWKVLTSNGFTWRELIGS